MIWRDSNPNFQNQLDPEELQGWKHQKTFIFEKPSYVSSFKAFFVFKNPKIFWFQKILNKKLLVFETLKKKKRKKTFET